MKFMCYVWLCILWLVNQGENAVFGLHVQQAPEIVQRITRQAARYGAGGAINVQNYRPSASTNFNGRSGVSDPTTSLTASQLNSVSANAIQRPGGVVGAYSFGGMASGRPTNGNSFVVNNNSIKGSGMRVAQPNIGHTIVGSGSVAGETIGRPQQLQQALLKAAQYQLQQQQQQQLQLQQHQQQQQLRRHMAQQQVYRPRPANAYQQYTN